ncbi:MAG: hypothetical protein ACD_22C00284G0006 [uncultured bacterium]|nr:MAG: hypothetical protein ACD_22C00284G0006 [uncultured bacterium]
MPSKTSPSKKDMCNINLSSPLDSSINSGHCSNPIFMGNFVEERTKLHTICVIETEKTKRISLLIGASLIVIAALIVIFAPIGKEVVSYWIGGSLLIFSAGSVGYKRVLGKTKGFSVSADQNCKK